MPLMVMAHVAWMEHYTGDVATLHAGAFHFQHAEHDPNNSGEAHNFLPYNGKCFGYIPLNAGGIYHPRLALTNIDPVANRNAAELSGVAVIWTARHPETKRRVIVGWYRNAVVRSKAKEVPAWTRGPTRYCYFQASASDAFLLPGANRNFEIPTANRARAEGKSGSWPGNSAIFYVGTGNRRLATSIASYVRRKEQTGIAQSAMETRPLIAQRDLDQQLAREIALARKLPPPQRRSRAAAAPRNPSRVMIVSQGFLRNPYVIAEVLIRANGKCESCRSDAPFISNATQEPYLEVHHKIPLANGGDDTVDNAVALCPNCHRREHFGPPQRPLEA